MVDEKLSVWDRKLGEKVEFWLGLNQIFILLLGIFCCGFVLLFVFDTNIIGRVAFGVLTGLTLFFSIWAEFMMRKNIGGI